MRIGGEEILFKMEGWTVAMGRSGRRYRAARHRHADPTGHSLYEKPLP